MIKAILSKESNVTPINFNVTKRNQRMRVNAEKAKLDQLNPRHIITVLLF